MRLRSPFVASPPVGACLTTPPHRLGPLGKAATHGVTGLAVAIGALWPAQAAYAQTPETIAPVAPVAPGSPIAPLGLPTKTGIQNSPLDGQLFYQLLISEVRLKQEPGYAYQIYLQLAKQHKSSQLFHRSVDIALAARAGEQALAAAKAWHQALPQERQACEYTAQILLALDRPQALVEPLGCLIQLSPQPQRPQVLAGLTRSLARVSDRKAVAKIIDEITQPWREPPANIAEAWATSAEAWLAAGDQNQALSRLKQAQAIDSQSFAVGVQALEMMGTTPETEAIVTQQLASKPNPMLRLAYARKLLSLQRTAEAAPQLDQVVAQQPDNALAWLSLGAARAEMNQLDAAEQATQRYIALATASQTTTNATPSNAVQALNANTPPMWDPALGYIKMAQISERRQQLAQADQWLQKADPQGEKLNVQIIRAKLLAAQGQLPQAQTLIHNIPETEPRDALIKLSAEAQLLREAAQHEPAYRVLSQAHQRFPTDPELIYELSMVADRLKKFDESEALLRQLISLRPDQANAYNALGYSLVERGIRLDEARTLLTKALQLRPGDPFITDSMGWLEYRDGRTNEALALLQQAHASRPDAEIAAHLGEVLWQLERRDEARQIWRDAQQRDPQNELLKSTLERLKVNL